MFKKLFLISTLLGSASGFSQIFSDNFDSYTAGDFIVSSNPLKWSTWSGGAGGSAEDTKISNTRSKSAPNSLHFKSTSANGGPSDIILKFDEVYTSGTFTLNMSVYLESGKGGYFNLQQSHTVGQVWALNCHMLNTGVIKFTDKNNAALINGTVPMGQWFDMTISVDLTTNIWDVLIDGTSIGTFSNSVNSIGILDLYPVNSTSEGGNGQSEFYIDDVSYNHMPAALPPVNGGVTHITAIDGLAGQSVSVTSKIRNLGTTPITSFDLTYTYAGGTPVTESITGVNIPSLSFYEYTFTTPVTLIGGSKPLQVKIENVNNGGADDNAADDAKTITINPVIPAAGKIVVGEEGTGTWCQWCPRGAVFMDMMANKYNGFWAGIAVHNNDPMKDPIYDAGMGSKIQGYPSALVDRGTSIDPSQMEGDFIQRVKVAPKATLVNGASFDAQTRRLDVTVTYTFNASVSSAWKTACVLTEDDVRGTTSGYNQANAYANNAAGEMGGFESLPNPVPAAQMVYNHVARKIEPSFAGAGNVFPANTMNGTVHTICYSFDIPSTWDISKMNIVGLLINNSGKIDNASFSSVSDAVANGLASCDATMGLSEVSMEDYSFDLYPNPANDMAFVDIIGANGEEITLTVTDLTGKVVAERNYAITGNAHLPIQTSHFAKGTYLVQLAKGNVVTTKKLIVH